MTSKGKAPRPLAGWAVTLALAVGSFALACPRLGAPFEMDQSTQRVFMARRPLGDILRHRAGDSRIPEGYYLLLHFFTDRGLDEASARLPSAIFGALSVALLHRLALACFGPGAAFTSSVLLALTPGFLLQARDVGPVTMFVFFGLASSAALVRVLERGRTVDAALYVAASAVMSQTSLFAPLLLGAHAVYVLAFRGERKLAFWALAGAAVAGLPAWLAIATQLPADFAARRKAAEFPTLVWGDLGFVSYVRALAVELLPRNFGGRFPPGFQALSIPFALCGAVVCLRRPVRHGLLWVFWLAVPLTAGLLLIQLVRVKGYYFVFALPALAALTAEGAQWAGDRIFHEDRRHRPIVALFIVAAYALSLWSGRGEVYTPRPRADIPELVSDLRSEGGPRTVVFDPDYLHTLLVYYAATDPVAAFSNCRYSDAWSDEPFVDCRFDGWRFVGLTHSATFSADWQGRAVRQLRRIGGEGALWYIDDPGFSNREAEPLLQENCTMRVLSWHRLYLCRKLS